MKKLKSIFNFIEDPEGLFLSFFKVNSNRRANAIMNFIGDMTNFTEKVLLTTLL